MEQTTNDDLNDHAVERAMREDKKDPLKLRVMEKLIRDECTALADMLAEKNRNYGSSAMEPVRIFSKADRIEGIRVRIDDKLSRLMRGSAAGEDVVLDLLGYLILLRVATRKKNREDVHVAASPEVIDEVLAAANEKRSAPENRPIGWVHVSGAAWFPNPSAEEPREDVGFALTDAEAAEAERAVNADWGGAVRRKLGVARGHLDSVADDLEEVGGWEETVKEIRQTLRETAAPYPPPQSDDMARQQRDALWMLLDNIDTLDDSCRDDDQAFRECARKIQRRRFNIHNPEGGKAAAVPEQNLRAHGEVFPAGPITCLICDKTFDTAESFAGHGREHIRTLDDEAALTAAYEAAGISDLSNLAHHIQALRGAEKYLTRENKRLFALTERDARDIATLREDRSRLMAERDALKE